jgi:hypothetical protein
MTENHSRPPLALPSLATEEELKTELQKVLNLKIGNVRGVSLNSDTLKPIEALAGAGALEKIQTKLTQLGFDIDINHFKSYEWYPAGYEAALLLVAAHLYGWSEDDIDKLGRVSTRGSMFSAIMMRFTSVEAMLRGGPEYWRKHYDYGEFVPIGHSEGEHSITFQIKGASIHPILEIHVRGYFKGLIELATGSENVVLQANKSAAQGDEYSEYTISW